MKNILLIFILLVSCNALSDEAEIGALIHQIYKDQNPFRNDNLDEMVFSQNLQGLLSAAKKIEKESIESIPESELSNIKPHLIEGEIFASLYEGYTSFEILKITEQ
ncbi:unnamed protein product [Ectocarpus sp. 12 AP-2014]